MILLSSIIASFVSGAIRARAISWGARLLFLAFSRGIFDCLSVLFLIQIRIPSCLLDHLHKSMACT